MRKEHSRLALDVQNSLSDCGRMPHNSAFVCMFMNKIFAAPHEAGTAFDLLGGEPVVRALVDRFYDLMDLEPQYAPLRALHAEKLDEARDKLFWFLCGWLGGPNHYVDRFGHPKLRARHLPFPIGVSERDQWLACMFQAMQDTQVPDALRQRLEASFFNTADWMRNT